VQQPGLRADHGSTPVDDEDAVGTPGGADAMGDDEERPVARRERALHPRLGGGVEVAVASSRITSGAGAAYARASVTSCRSPADNAPGSVRAS